MNFDLSLLDDETTILATPTSDFNFGSDIQAFNADLLAILDLADSPLALIMDVRELRPDFGTLVSAMAMGTRGSSVVFGHPLISHHIFITSNALVKIGAKAFSQEQYGGIHTTVVATLEEALEIVSADA